MKKALILGIVLLLIVGCSSSKKNEQKDKVLLCTVSDSAEGISMTATLTYTFDSEGKKLQYEEVVLEVTYQDTETIESDYDSLMEECNAIKYLNGVSCDVKMTGKKLTQIATIDYLNSDKETLDEISVITDYSYERLKSEYKNIETLSCE